MAKGLVKVNTGQLEVFTKKLEKAASSDVDTFLKDCAKALAARLLRRTIQKTPKDTGNLQRGWTGKSSSSPEQWAESARIEHTGKEYNITISNPVEYAPYVEYGHRTPDHIGWVPGQFMLTLSIEEMESMKTGILETMLADFLNKVFR